MKNPDYHPDTAHLPSARDKELWMIGGWKKEKAARENLAKVRAKWDSARTSAKFNKILNFEENAEKAK